MQIYEPRQTSQQVWGTAELRDAVAVADLSPQPPLSPEEHYVVWQAELLTHSPEAVRSQIFPEGYRLEYPSNQCDNIRYFILITPLYSRILSTGNTLVPSPNHTDHIRERISLVDLKAGGYYEDSSWLRCLSQLIQIELDRSILNAAEHRNAFRLLRELAQENILPCSLFIDVRKHESHPGPINCPGSSDIYKGRLNGAAVCVKVLRHFDQEAYKQFLREGVVWRQLKHPNILQCLGISQSFIGDRLSLVSYWMENGNLMEFVRKNPKHERLYFIRQIASAIQYLHGHQPPIAHRDIKGVNIMVKDDWACCLADFGLASILETQRSTDPGYGTLYWQAPERLDPDTFPEDRSGCPADIYSFAWTIVEICCGSHPFQLEKRTPVQVLNTILNGDRIKLPPTTSVPIDSGIWDIVDACWCQQPNQRLEIGQVVEKLSLLSPVVKPPPNSRSLVPVLRPFGRNAMGVLTPPMTPLLLPLRPHTPYVDSPSLPSMVNMNILEPILRPPTPIRSVLNRVQSSSLPSPPVTPFQSNISVDVDRRERAIQFLGIEHESRNANFKPPASRRGEEIRSHISQGPSRRPTLPRLRVDVTRPLMPVPLQESPTAGRTMSSSNVNIYSHPGPRRPFHFPIVEED